MTSHGKVVHSPPKSKSSDDTFATPTVTPDDLEETSLPGTLGGDIQCGQNPLDQETSKLEGPMATSTQKPDNPMETSLWERPQDKIDDRRPNLRSGANAGDNERRLLNSIELAKLNNPAMIMQLLGKLYQTSVDEALKSRKAKSDTYQIAMILGAVVGQLLDVGELAMNNSNEAAEALKDVDTVADKLSKLVEQHNSLVERVYKEDPMQKSKDREYEQVKKDVRDLFKGQDNLNTKVSGAHSRLDHSEQRESMRKTEVDQLRKELSELKQVLRRQNEEALAKSEQMQGQIDTLLSRVAASAAEHAQQLANARSEIARLEGGNLATPLPQPGHSELGAAAEQPAPNTCVACKAVFPTARDLQNHANKYHKDAAQFPILCTYCPSRFRDVAAQMSHMVAKHGDKATIMPSSSTARLHHLSYIVPGIKIPATITDMGKIELEERRQTMLKIKEIRPDFDSIHIQYWRRLTPDNGVVHGVEYQMLVIFYDELHRQMLHQSNLANGGSLLPYVDNRQIAQAKQMAEQGMAPFLGNGSGVMSNAGNPAAMQHPLAVPYVPQPGRPPFPERTGGGMGPALSGAAPAPATTPASLLTPMPTNPLPPQMPIKPFFHDPPTQTRQDRRGGRGRGGQLWNGRRN